MAEKHPNAKPVGEAKPYVVQAVDHMHRPVIVTDGGRPWAEHDMACAVCHQSSAVIDVGTGVFQPCWSCQQRGYRLVWKRRWLKPLWKNQPPAWTAPNGRERAPQ